MGKKKPPYRGELSLPIGWVEGRSHLEFPVIMCPCCGVGISCFGDGLSAHKRVFLVMGWVSNFQCKGGNSGLFLDGCVGGIVSIVS